MINVDMILGFSTSLFAFVLLVVLFGGTVKGVVGFGYSVAGTAVLAVFLEPSTAVALMIIPMLVANISLLTELTRDGLKSCARRFWHYVAAALVGAIVGTVFVNRVPKEVLALVLGILVVGYVASKQKIVDVRIPSPDFLDGIDPKPVLGFVSGIVFGSSNIGIQTVMYLDRMKLDRSTFIGVVSMYFVGISSMRVVTAWMFGLYSSTDIVVVSVLASVVGLLGVGIGVKTRHLLPDRVCHDSVLTLFFVVGARLVYVGVTGIV
ncbi:MAG: sulfite exporter TauE/SafE family protein [Halobacteria archaeon]|nr:sulfite exporter TauE/SafE family protein [Halobacteria archaeon]